DSSSDAEKPSRTRSWHRAVKRMFSLFVPRKIQERRWILRIEKTEGRDKTLELKVPWTQAGQPMDSRALRADGHQEPDHTIDECDEPTPQVGLKNPNVPEDLQTHEDPARTNPAVPTPGTGGRVALCLAPGSTTGSESLAIITPASTRPDELDTKQTTPPEQPAAFSQGSDEERSQRSSVKSISLEDLSPVSTNSEWYIKPVFVVANNNRHKEPALMALDTQASANLMDLVLCKELGMSPEPCSQDLLPLQTESGNEIRIAPHGRVRRVAWHFAGSGRTYVSDFLVVDLRDYNAILGKRDIRRLKILAPGPGLGGHAR
ncbi:retropepsin-like aspartic protease, partial [Aspergillus ibericus CBS 121593]